MTKFLKVFQISLVIFLISFSASPFLAFAQTKQPAQSTASRCQTFKDQFKLGSTNIIGSTTVYCSASELIVALINFIQVIAGTVTSLFLMIGGFLYITSAGNDEQLEKGKKILINSVIGLVVIIMSYAIVRIVSGLITLGK